VPKPTFTNYADELQSQAAAWEHKPGLRAIYHRWYRRIVAHLSPLAPTIEIGAGCGSFKRFYPAVVATDVIRTGDWIDRTVDARNLPYGAGSVGNFVLIDCLHHLPRPVAFLRHALEALKTGGRIVLLEPAATPWARLVWRAGHHEPVDLHHDFLAEDYLSEPANPGFTYANMGTAHWLFVRHAPEVMARLPPARLVCVEFSDVLAYPASGGFSYRGLLRGSWLQRLHACEAALVPQWIGRWIGLRMLVVVENTAAATHPDDASMIA